MKPHGPGRHMQERHYTVRRRYPRLATRVQRPAGCDVTVWTDGEVVGGGIVCTTQVGPLLGTHSETPVLTLLWRVPPAQMSQVDARMAEGHARVVELVAAGALGLGPLWRL